MDINHRAQLISSVGEEVISQEDLHELLKEKPHPIAYNGFEPSGKIHIAQSVLVAINMNKLIDAGCKVKMFVADWHAQANNKLGGDLDKIQTTGRYFIEVWKASGMKLDQVEFIWASDLVKDPNYWQLVLKIAMMNSVDRIKRCSQIMGRSDEEGLSAAQILYPCMQAADIFYMGVDICQLGMDQRKVNVLAREMAPKLGHRKPVIVSHHMLAGLLEPPKDVADPVARATAMKMSKSIPDSAIFSTDTAQEVEVKIKKAYCPAGDVKENPILEYCKYLIFERFESVVIKRPEKFGGDLTFKSYTELEGAFAEGKVHPMDLKTAVAHYVNETLQPIRDHFTHDEVARKLKNEVESYSVTR
jgi:tyrosyl-tRNA synthetase